MAERDRWEYLTRLVWMDHDNRDKKERGWALVGMMQYAQQYGGFGATGGIQYLTYEYIFKRRLMS